MEAPYEGTFYSGFILREWAHLPHSAYADPWSLRDGINPTLAQSSGCAIACVRLVPFMFQSSDLRSLFMWAPNSKTRQSEDCEYEKAQVLLARNLGWKTCARVSSRTCGRQNLLRVITVCHSVNSVRVFRISAM
jgi:hypothetical protein